MTAETSYHHISSSLYIYIERERERERERLVVACFSLYMCVCVYVWYDNMTTDIFSFGDTQSGFFCIKTLGSLLFLTCCYAFLQQRVLYIHNSYKCEYVSNPLHVDSDCCWLSGLPQGVPFQENLQVRGSHTGVITCFQWKNISCFYSGFTSCQYHSWKLKGAVWGRIRGQVIWFRKHEPNW